MSIAGDRGRSVDVIMMLQGESVGIGTVYVLVVYFRRVRTYLVQHL